MTHTLTLARGRRIAALAAVTVAALAVAAPAAAASPAPGWLVRSIAQPTNFAPGDSTGNDTYVVIATNIGARPTDGSTISLDDTLPAGVSAQSVSLFGSQFGGFDLGPYWCTTAPVHCNWFLAVAHNGWIEMIVHVTNTLPEGAMTPPPSPCSASQPTSPCNSVTVSGGGAPDATASSSNPISSTDAPFAIADFGMTVAGADGTADTQAGDHPASVTSTFDVTTKLHQTGEPDQPLLYVPSEFVKDVVVDLPLGFIGNPQAAPRCPADQLMSASGGNGSGCPAATKVGEVTLGPNVGPPLYSSVSPVQFVSSLYNIVPERGFPAEFGFVITGENPTFLYGTVVPTPAGYVLRVMARDIPTLLPSGVGGVSLTFFGDPATEDGSGATPSAFFTNPVDCSASSPAASMYTDSWSHPGRLNPDGTPDLSDPTWKQASAPQSPVTGCDRLHFGASLTARPDTTVADSPSGLNVDLQVPQAPNLPGDLATPELRKASVTLPAGVSVSPSAAAGLQACTPQEIGLGSTSEPTCPDASKIGAVEVDTPLLPDPLKGSVFVAQQGNNPFGSLLAIYVTAEADGALIKLAGHVVPDPATGQLTTTFDNNPQLPFSEFKLDFFGGHRGVLATPESCGTFTTTSEFTPWSAPDSGPTAQSSDPFAIDSGCVSGFGPSFTAGVQNPQAGRFSPFVLSFSRSDTDQELSGLSVKLPPGMLAKLAGVAQCSDAQLAQAASHSGAAELASPSCPSGSQVGTVTTGAGPGPDPFFLSGRAYLTGPYKGAPYGLAVVVPAVAGPYDLGTVVVRQALYVDPTTAQVTAVSDPFPTILQGIPLRLRRVDVNLNRPSFTLNPTSCDPMAVSGILSSTGGLSTTLSPRFQVGGCQELGFSPRLSISLTGRGRTRSGAHPNLTATLTQPGGQANIRSARVALPLSLALDTANSQNVCSYDVAKAVHGGPVGCPASTIVGKATAVTPLLSQPLTGNVYLVQGIRFGAQGQRIRTLPTLLVPLRGQIALDLRASSAVNGAQQLVTTFSTIPDAPVSKFSLQINGGRKGILVITGRGLSICQKAQVANASFGAQSGRPDNQNDTLSTPCAAPARLRVLSHRISGHALLLRVRSSARGRLTVTGPGLRRLSRVLGAGVHTLRVALARGARAAAVQVHVGLQPANARGATHTFTTRL